MEEKIFNLMEKMYVDLSSKIDSVQSDLSSRMDSVQSDLSSRMDGLQSEILDVKSNMATKHDIVRIESKMDNNFTALYDGYQQSIEGICELRGEIRELTIKVENQEIRLQVLRTVK